MVTAEFCPRNEELAVMCLTMVTLEYKKIERYIWGLPESIQGNVTSSNPATTHDDIRMAYNLMDQVVRAKAIRGNDGNKQKWKDHQGGNTDNNNHHHQQNRRQEADKAYVAAPAERLGYAM
ncbi:hypothetical protein Tco_0694541 [Tanacetum coccineum]